MRAPFVGVAFLRGDPYFMRDGLVMQSTGGPFVHTEFVLGWGQDVRCYTAFGAPGRNDPVNGFVPSRRTIGLPDGPRWEVVTFPVRGGAADYWRAYAFVLQLVAMRVPYNYQDLWQCCVKIALPYERDVDCDVPASWQRHGVFCSQACLLLLRAMVRKRIISLPQDISLSVERTNSRGCSPNALHHMLRVNRLKKKSI